MTSRCRIDQLLVDRRMADSREKAQALILAGSVLVNGQREDKVGHTVPADSTLELLSRPKYVSRGGIKLEAALVHWNIPVDSAICLDVGSSTGGFTDCLLQHGAARVYAIDVGTNQLDWKLRNDPRVVSHEQTNARYLGSQQVPEEVRLIACDVSFISVTMILPRLPPLLARDGEMVILVKPQFELERGEVGKGGIVRDPALHLRVCERVKLAVRGLGFQSEAIPSPIRGAEGNIEFLLYAKR